MFLFFYAVPFSTAPAGTQSTLLYQSLQSLESQRRRRFSCFCAHSIVGINTAYNILMNYPDTVSDPTSLHAGLAKLLKEEYLDKGKTGINAGESFYKYN